MERERVKPKISIKFYIIPVSVIIDYLGNKKSKRN